MPAAQPDQLPAIPPIWDVDNDNDGVPDSIWIDPGLPVVTRPDGRRYKRLVAILIKDLDGRINLNAHGNLAGGTDGSDLQLPGRDTRLPQPGLGHGRRHVGHAAHIFPAASASGRPRSISCTSSRQRRRHYGNTGCGHRLSSNLLRRRYASHPTARRGG